MPYLLYAEGGYGLETILQSDPVVEVQPGQIFNASILVVNRKDKECDLNAKIDLPEGWVSLPFQLPPFHLSPQESKIQIIPIRVPDYAPSKEYSLTFSASGREDASLFSAANFKVVVLPRHEISSYVESAPKYAMSGDNYKIEVRVTNRSNHDQEVFFEVENYKQCEFKIYPSPSVLLPMDGSQLFTIEVLNNGEFKKTLNHHFFIRSFFKDHPTIEKKHHVKVEVFPTYAPAVVEHHLFPVKTKIDFGQKEEQTQFYFEQSGKGSIDEARNHKLDFYARIPVTKHDNLTQFLSGKPEKAYIHYWSKATDVYLGDGVFSLTPLTLKDYYGRGGSLSYSSNSSKIGGVYVKQKHSIAEEAIGGFFSYSPLPFWSLSIASIHLKAPQKIGYFSCSERNSTLTSFHTRFSKAKLSRLELEYAASNFLFKPNEKQYAFYSRLDALFGSSSKFSFQNVYAAPNFVGYYRDNNIVDASLVFPIYKKFRGNFSYHLYQTNLDKRLCKGPATRGYVLQGTLANHFSSSLYSSLSFNRTAFRDALVETGYETNYLSLNLGKTSKKWSLQGALQAGGFNSLNQKSIHVWQSYQLYSYFMPLPSQTYALYSRIGYNALLDRVSWSNIYGASAKAQIQDRINLQLVYEFTQKKGNQQFASMFLSYELPRHQTLDFRGNWTKQEGSKPKLDYLLTYTIPWGIPLGKKKNSGAIQGKVTRPAPDGTLVPYANLPINCNRQRYITNANGEFAFSHLEPGECLITVEDGSENLSPSIPLPLKLSVEKGKISPLGIEFKQAARIDGTVELYKRDSYTGPCHFARKWEGAGIMLYSLDHPEELVATTNYLGSFSFNKLTPGKYRLKVFINKLPAHHTIEPEEMKVEVKPGEALNIPIKIVPLERTIRFIQ
jgi:hypothetical protein